MKPAFRMLTVLAVGLSLTGMAHGEVNPTFYVAAVQLKLALQNHGASGNQITLTTRSARTMVDTVLGRGRSVSPAEKANVLAVELDDCAAGLARLIVLDSKDGKAVIKTVSENIDLYSGRITNDKNGALKNSRAYFAPVSLIDSDPADAYDYSINGGMLNGVAEVSFNFRDPTDICPTKISISMLGAINVSFMDMDQKKTRDAIISAGSSISAVRLK